MVPEGQLRRLRVTGVIALSVIAAMVIAQLLIVQWRFQSAPNLTDRVNESGLRRALVMTALYDATLATQSKDARLSMADALTSLRTRQENIKDLRGPALDEYNAFLTTATQLEHNPNDAVAQTHLGELGKQLFENYDQLTTGYADQDNRIRATIRIVVITANGIILLTLLLLYIFISRRRDQAINAAIRGLEEKRQRFAAMFDNSAEMMALYDPDGNVIRANPTAVERMGFGLNAVARHFDIHVAPRDRAMVARHFAQALGGKATEFETTFIDAFQNEVPVLTSLAPVIVDKRVVGVVGSARDMSAQRRAEEELLRSREHFRSLFEHSTRPIIAMTPDGTLTHINVAFEKMTGYKSEELLGKSALVLVSADRREMTLARLKGFEKIPHTAYEGLTLTKSGQEVPVEVEISPIRVHEHLEGYYVKYRDLSREHAIARAVSGKDERMRALYRVASSNESATVQIGAALALGARGLGLRYGYVCALEGDILEVKYRFAADEVLLPIGHKMKVTSAIGRRLRESSRAVGINDLTKDPDVLELVERGLPWECYIGARIMLKDGFWGIIVFLDRKPRTIPFDDADLDFVDVMGTMITGALTRDARDRDLEQQAFHDTLTGAVNRRLFEEHVQKAMARAHRLRGAVALHFIDLNGFKAINDQHGHDAGDEVLREVVQRLNSVVRDQDVVARIGGDEFVILETDMASDADATILATRMRETFAPPMRLSSGVSLDVGCSLGTAVYPRDGACLTDLLKHADLAMYAMKRHELQ